VINNQSSFILNDVEILQNSIDSCFIEASRYASVTSLQDLRVCTVRQTNISRHFFFVPLLYMSLLHVDRKVVDANTKTQKVYHKIYSNMNGRITSYVLQQNLSQDRIIF